MLPLAFFILDDAVEIGIGIAVVVVIALVWLYKSLTKTATTTATGTTVGKWTTSPASIPAATATGTFVYSVTNTPKGGGGALPVINRVIQFDMGPLPQVRGYGKIVSVTDSSGTTVAVNGWTCKGTTDVTGSITVVVELESKESANLVATDVKSGQSDPPIIFQAQ